MSLEKKVLSIVSEITKVSISNLNQNSCLGNPSTWDSMAHTNLILMLEEAFDVSFEFDELDKNPSRLHAIPNKKQRWHQHLICLDIVVYISI